MPAFLVSLCNTEGKPGLVRFDTEGGFAPLDLPAFADVRFGRGATGIAPFRGGFAVGLQAPQPHLLLVGADLATAEAVPIEHANDIHGLLALEDGLAVVSSGTDQILRYDARLRFAGVLGHDPGVLMDRDHLNDLAVLDGRILVSCFGPRRADGLRKGAIRDAITGQALFDGLNEPHSLCVQDGALRVLDSGTGALLRVVPGIGAVRETMLVGYARGLWLDAARMLIGRSARRGVGRSSLFQHPQRRAATRQGAQESHQAGIFVVDRATDAHAFHALGALGTEIYAIHPIP
jgi:hypothetical protein